MSSKKRFGSYPFEINQDVTFRLGFRLQEDLFSKYKTKRELFLFLSSSNYFDQSFDSLMEYFNISKYAIATRLEELYLIE